MTKKILKDFLKFLSFFILWAILIPISYFLKIEDPVLRRLWFEFTPFFLIVVITVMFARFVEKPPLKIPWFTNAGRNTLMGLGLGLGWLGLIVLVLWVCGVIRFNGVNEVPYLGVWVLSSLLNVIMQELLVRGYLYQLLKRNYSRMAALVATTALFTLLHGGAFEAGIIAVLNVLTMSVFVTLLLEYTGSLLAPTIVHFVWNTVGSIFLGAVSLAEDYPHLLNCSFTGPEIVSGGIYKIEGSIVVLIANVALSVLFFFLLRKKNRKTDF